MNTLEFDIDKLKNMQKQCEDLKDQIKGLKDELFKYLEDLKKDWNTPAGKKFFSELDTDWTAHVEHYATITEAIGELLGVAVKGYEGLVEEAKAINL